MTKEFSREQIKVYASHFREGDAIWCVNKWYEVVTNSKRMNNNEAFRKDKRLSTAKANNNCINRGIEEDYKPYFQGFKGSNSYRITTLKHYKLQGKEKIVWLGDSDDFRTFGKVYRVENYNTFTCDKGISNWSICSENWGIIPRHEEVKNLKKIPISKKINQVINDELNKEKEESGVNNEVLEETVSLKLRSFEILSGGSDIEYIEEQLRELAELAIDSYEYDRAIEIYTLIKEWRDL